MRVIAGVVVSVLLVPSATTAQAVPDQVAAADPAPPTSTSGEPQGFVDEAWFTERQNGYLRFATEQLNESAPANVLAHLERAERDPSFSFDASQITPGDFAGIFEFIEGSNDTSDFDLMRLVALYYEHGDELTPELRQAIEDAMVGYRYWFTDPLPEGVVDEKYFWSENHRIIFHTLEYLGGQALPDATFEITGETGAEHRRRGRARIERWLAEKARWGFSEWHSDVYYPLDVRPLLLLVEHAEDPELRERAAMLLDSFLYDLALHQHDANLGVTHGRSYMKDKSRATDQGTFELMKLAFDSTDVAYQSRADASAVFLAASERYRMPEVIRRVATTTETIVDREHMNVPFDLDRPYEEDPTSPAPGVSLDDVDDVDFWWDRGGLTAWPVVPLTLRTIDTYDLFETELFAPYQPLADLVDGDPQAGAELAHSLRCMVNFGLLDEVDTITYRSAEVMLSSAQDYRPGCGGGQYHAWQATLDSEAIVFTTHPGNEPFGGTDGYDDDDRYWTGTATMPRSAQHGAAAIHLYAPGFADPGSEGPLGAFAYLDYTHAFFPTERFDEVRQVGNWTLGRDGDAYVALWSWRDVQWKPHDPAVEFTGGLTENYDLVAPGGADNAWIVEVGDAATWSSFDGFAAAVTGTPPEVTDLGTTDAGLPAGFEVTYQSPTEGELQFSSDGPFAVDGRLVSLHGSKRYDNPFGTTVFGSDIVRISDGEVGLNLNFATWERTATAGGAPPPPPSDDPVDVACPGGAEHGFADVSDANVHADTIACSALRDIVRGFTGGTFGPDLAVERDQPAPLIARALASQGVGLAPDPPDAFDDDVDNVHERAIDRLAEAGIVEGRAPGVFEPDSGLRRDQLAATLVRAYELATGTNPVAAEDHFGDDGDSVHEADIDVAFELGITQGVTDTLFDPDGTVTREQMASFATRLAAALIGAESAPAG